MARVNCPKCGEQRFDDGPCPNCGHRSRTFRLALGPLLWPVLALSLIFGAGAFLRGRMRADIARRHAAERAALRLSIPVTEACQQIVLKTIRSPAAARFDTTMMAIPSGDSILVLGSVEAQSGSGATAKNRFRCGMRRDTVKDVWVGSAFVVTAPKEREARR